MTNAKNSQELEQENRLLRQILDHISDGVQVVTKDGQIIVYNKTMEKIEGTDSKYVLGYNDTEVYNVFSQDKYIRSEMLASGKPIKNRRMTYHMATGYKVEMVTDAYPYVENGELTAFYYIMQDISNINHLQERIMTLSNLLSQEKEQKAEETPTELLQFSRYYWGQPIHARNCPARPSDRYLIFKCFDLRRNWYRKRIVCPKHSQRQPL